MNESITPEHFVFDLTRSSGENLSPKSPYYAVHFFENCLREKLVQADSFVESVYRTITAEASTASQVVKAFEKGSRFVVDISDEMKDKIDKGQLKLVCENDRLRAQLLDENGRYGKKLDIKEEFFREGIDPVQMATALQLKAIQDQLQQITNQIIVINSSIIDILQGQQNDRIALFYSGLNLYLEAQSIKNPEMKSALMVQAIKALSDGTQQLVLTMESDVEFLKTRQYDKLRGKKTETVRNRMDSINKAFGFIHQATLVRAAIYCEQEEYLAMASVLDEYSRFIENTVVANANLLSQCEPNDDGTERGIWATRARLKLDVSDLKKCFCQQKKDYYILLEENTDEE